MGEIDVFGGESLSVFDDGLVIQMEFTFPIEVGGFTNQDIGVFGSVDEFLRPSGIAGKGNGFIFHIKAEDEVIAILQMLGGIGQDTDTIQTLMLVFLELDEEDFEIGLFIPTARIQRVHGFDDTVFDPFGPCNNEGVFSFRQIARIHEEKDHASEMVTVQVAEKDGVDAVGIDVELLHGNEGAGATVNQEGVFWRFNMETGVKTAPCPKSIPAAQKLDVNIAHFY